VNEIDPQRIKRIYYLIEVEQLFSSIYPTIKLNKEQYFNNKLSKITGLIELIARLKDIQCSLVDLPIGHYSSKNTNMERIQILIDNISGVFDIDMDDLVRVNER